MSEDDDDRDFTAADRRRLRRMMEREERVEWFWGSLRVWAGWVGGVATAVFAIYQAIKEVGLFKKFGGP